jgi:hypothetical protein
MSEMRDPAPLARAVIWSVYLYMASDILFGLACLDHNRRLDEAMARGAPFDPAALDGARTLVGSLSVAAFLVSGWLTLKWIYRVNANAQALASGMAIGPGWNVGWFFIPFANLIMPYRGLKQTWQVSSDPHVWPDVKVPLLLPAWWATWLATNLFGNAGFRLSVQVESARDQQLANLIIAGSVPLTILVCILLVKVVRGLSRLQAVQLHVRTFS